ncbi:hypothetical protein ONZ45_g9044 [Pleurotus djamor]|nr:hypothetical protein ONZ45_g9044 [Pleurotus djamor]
MSNAGTSTDPIGVDDTPTEQQVIAKAVPRAEYNQYVNKLTPPPGTDYWRRQTFTVWDNVKLTRTSGSTETLYETLTWRIDAYVYVTYTQPSDNFASEGGSVCVILVHYGSAATGSYKQDTMEYRYNVSLQNPPGGSAAVKQLPPSNSGIQSGNSWSYPISFTQDMQMFNNGGTNIFTFTADYEDSIDLDGGTQVGFVDGSSGTQWSVMFDNPVLNSNFAFGSLSVFTFSSLEEVTFNCKASVIQEYLGGPSYWTSRRPEA